MCIRDRVGLVGPSFGPFDEFHGQDEGDGECDLAEALSAEPIGVAAELAEVGEPGVGSFDGPAQAQAVGLLGLGFGGGGLLGLGCALAGSGALGCALGRLLGADDVGESEAVAALGGEQAVVALVQVQGLDVGEQAAVGDGLQGWFEQDAVVAVRSVDDPADGDRRTGRWRSTTSTRSWLCPWLWHRYLHHRTGLCAGCRRRRPRTGPGAVSYTHLRAHETVL